MSEKIGVKRLEAGVTKLESALSRLEKGVVGCCGATFAQCRTITVMGQYDTISLNGLAGRLGLDKSTTSRMVNSLVKSGLAHRRVNSADRRSIALNLTAEGRRVCDYIAKGNAEFYSRLHAAIPEDKMAQVLESIEELLKALEAVSDNTDGEWHEQPEC